MRIRRVQRTLRKTLPATTVAALLASLVTLVLAADLNFHPGFDLFSVAQDVQVGQENAAQVEKQMPVLDDEQASRYVNQLGRRLSSYAPDNRREYVWRFRVLNSGDINAFALPGGYIYVNRATIESAEDEAELAGVLAHEEGHVVLRHGTHQASEVMLAQKPLEILGGLVGGQDSTLFGQLLQLGVGVGVQSFLLHNSRTMEAQADSVGTYILYRAGYDPHAMAQFFGIIERRYPQQTLQFFSDHPNPGNRIKAVDEEIPELGPAKAWTTDNPDFEFVKSRVRSLPPPPKPKPQPG
ncbi:MAG TPA: M48 family metallopeptidase [Terriglobia bacterium]